MEAQDPPPPAIQNRPILFGDLTEIWEAFWNLNLSRQVGMGLGGIPLAEIVVYWRDIKGRDDIEEKTALIRAMDGFFLRHHQEQQGNK